MTSRRGDLEQEARRFAAEITGLLNNTVTNGIHLSARIDESGSALVRYERPLPDDASDDVKRIGSDLIPLTISKKPERFGLRVYHTLTFDDECKYLRNSQSSFVLATADGEAVFTYDYVRPAPNVYPEAHLHIDGKSESLQRLLDLSGQKKRNSRRLHLPVGGRRFRPCLEDIIEFCVTEGLVDAHPRWKGVLDEARERFYLRQLKAAVRRSPDAAIATLQEEGRI